MEVLVFSKYNVNYHCDYSYINEDEEFVDDKTDWVKVLSGSELLSLIAGLLNDVFCIYARFIENELCVEHFCELSGESSSYKIVFTEELMSNGKF